MRYYLEYEGDLALLSQIQKAIALLRQRGRIKEYDWVEIEWGYRRDGIWVRIWCDTPWLCKIIQDCVELGYCE